MKFTAEFRLATAAFMVVLLVTPSRASFEPLPVGGRAAGMSEAYSAIVDDVFALYYNPAGVMQLTRPEIGTYYSQLYPGLTDNSKIDRMFLGYAQPLGKGGRLGGIGASYMSLQLSGLYKEEAMGLTYGREHRNHRLNYGASLKMLKKSIGSDEYSNNAIDPTTGASFGGPDPVLAKGTSKSAIGLDLGAQYRLSQAYALGVAGRNINSPDLGIDQTDKVPSVLTMAVARRLRAGSLDFEVTKWKGAKDVLRLALGGEKWFKNGFGVRAGGASGAGATSVSFGASFKLESFQFDYAMIYPMSGIEGTLGIQQVSLTARLGKAPVDPLELQLIKEKEERIRAETEVRAARAERDRLKKQLLELTDEKTRSAQQAERRAAQKALDEAQMQESREERAAKREVLNAYTAALTDYNARVTQGVSLAEKRRMLEKIQSEFAGKEIDVATVNRELRDLKNEEAKARKDFELSMSFYSRLVQQGASADERRSMLERIIQKYKDSGVDIRSAEDQMGQLK